MVTNEELHQDILIDLKKIVIEALAGENVKVYLFGSWARNEERQSSDIDIAVEASGYLSPLKWLDLQDKVEESTIPYHVDIVNLKEASSALIQNVKREGIVWKDFMNA